MLICKNKSIFCAEYDILSFAIVVKNRVRNGITTLKGQVMEIFLVLTFLFCVGSTLGWCIELVFRRIVHKKWINPGFLVGPYLPLYGVGLIFLFAVCMFDYSFIEQPVLRDLFVILVITVLMTVIEYITGLIFIKGMKVKLWDYSDRKFNIQGIICPLFTLFWGIIGAVYYFFIHSAILGMVQWFTANIAYSFVIGMFFGVFVLDLIYSFKVVAKIKKFATEKQIVVKYEALKLSIREKADEFKQKVHYVFPMRSSNDFEKELDNYMQKDLEKVKNSSESKK